MDFQLIIVHKKVLKIHEIFLSNQFNIYPLEVNNKYESNLVTEFEMRPKYDLKKTNANVIQIAFLGVQLKHIQRLVSY